MALRVSVVVAPLAVLLGATAADAYIGPGAGFAVLSSFFVLALSFLMALTSLLIWPVRYLIRRLRGVGRPAGNVDRVVIVGLDGLDPGLAKQYMDEGKLPNFSRLAERGSFATLATSYPSISPAAWSSFMTGVDCSYHNIFDFLTRDPRTYKPVLSSAEISGPRTVSVGRLRVPIGRARVKLLRKSKPFWKLLGDRGIFSTIIRVPITFPPEKFNGVLLSGMCAPDVRGTQGTFSHYTTERLEHPEKEGGMTVAVVRQGDVIRTELHGPYDETRPGGGHLTTPLVFRIDQARNRVDVSVSGRRLALEVGGYSAWVPVTFKAGPGMKVHGICRFYLNSIAPEFDVYVTPVQIDPERPSLPVAHPVAYSVYLSKMQGRYGTLGLAEDTWALNEGVIDEDAFLDQAWLYFDERKAMLTNALDKTRQGVVVCVFDTSDRIQHMFFRCLDDSHPANAGRETARYRGVIENVYQRMDALVGEVLDRMTERDVLIVMSDHGFTPFRRGVNINTWLLQNGYLTLKNGATTSGPWFADVDWSRTKAYCLGLTGLFINRKGREGQGIVTDGAELKELKRELIGKMNGLVDSERGEMAIREVVDSASRFSGPYLDNGPDLLLGYNHGYRTSWDCAMGATTGTVFEDNTRRWSGDHCIDPRLVPGIFFSNRAIGATQPDIRDVAPTVLSLFGIEVPRYMAGTVLMKETHPVNKTKPTRGDSFRRSVRHAAWRLIGSLVLTAGLLAAAGPTPAGAATLTRLGALTLGTNTHDIAVDGQLAYVATDKGLSILDISNPASPTVRGSVVSAGSGKNLGVVVKDGYAYVAGQSRGLQIIDVRNPGAPAIVAVRKVAGSAWDVAIKDHIAYVVSFAGELYLFNVANPASPVQLRSIGLLAWASGAGTTNIQRLKNLYPSGGGKGTGVAVAGDHLVAVEWNYGRLYYWNVADPALPVYGGTYRAPYLLRVEADASRNVVYMMSAFGGTSGLYTIPISALDRDVSIDHASCGVCGYLPSRFGMDQGGVGVVPGGRYTFFAGGKGNGELHVVDAADPAEPVDAATTVVGPHYLGLAQSMGLAAIGDFLYLAAGRTGVQVFTFPGLSQ
jgi:predicted AlkP superfamily phosphohydrolase/phosphomutase